MTTTTRNLLHRCSQHLAYLLPGSLCAPLSVARQELHKNLRLAFRLASSQQRPVSLHPSPIQNEAELVLCLPTGVRWGPPSTVPLPPSLADSGWRRSKPRPITVMPHRRATANVWFLHHGREALCLRMALSGTVEMLWYRPLLGAWTPC